MKSDKDGYLISYRNFSNRPEFYRVPTRIPNVFDLIKQIEHDPALTEEEKKTQIRKLISLDRPLMKKDVSFVNRVLNVPNSIKALISGVLAERIE
jgi:hypothetical protein